MTISRSVCGWVIVVWAAAPSGHGAVQAGAGPLRKHPGNPRYFTDGTGRAVFLTGTYPQWNWQDRGLSDPPPAFDYAAYLGFLQQYNHNFIRLWVWEEARNYGSYPTGGYTHPVLYQRPGPGTARDGKPKFDLTKVNPAAFDRLRSRVIAARDRGIYVSVMLFQGWSLWNKTLTTWDPWPGHPFHRDNNVNGIDGDPNRDGRGIETHTLQNRAITSLQEAYLRKVVDSVNDLDNVLYEVSNESESGSRDWQYHVINYVKSYEATKPKRHPVGMTAINDPSALLQSPADWVSPDIGAASQNPPPADGRKVILWDDDHSFGWHDRASVWKAFLRGHNPIGLDPVDRDAWNRTRDSFIDVRRNLGYCLRYARRMNLAAATPRGDLASTGYALAVPGSEYLVYQPAGGAFSLGLSAGTYAVEWLQPGTGTVTPGGSAAFAAGTSTFSAPFAGDSVLYLKASTPPPPATGGGPVAWWKLDETAGGTASDSSGNGHHGALTGAPAWTGGRTSGGLALDGLDDYVNVPYDAGLAITSDVTISAWVKRRALLDYGGLVAKTDGNGVWDFDFQFVAGDNRLHFWSDATTPQSVASVGQVADTSGWHHVAVTRAGHAVAFYIDGAAAGTATMAGSFANHVVPVRIGTDGPGWASKSFYKGLLDDVRIYDRALSGAEIVALAGSAPPPPAPAGGAAAHWKLDETGGGTAADSSGNSNHGTLAGGPVWSTGAESGALAFDGVDDYVAAPYSASLGITGDITIAAWVKRGAALDYGSLVAKTDGSGLWDYDFQFVEGDNRLYFWSDRTTPQSAASTGVVADTAGWHHVAVTRAGTGVTFYVDGAAAGTAVMSGAFANNPLPVRIGTDGPAWASKSFFRGLLDDVRIYNRALTPSEIQGLADGGSVKALSASAPGADGGDSSSGGGACGALGLEAMLVLLAGTLARRRPRTIPTCHKTAWLDCDRS